MAYTDHFRLVDDLTAHLDGVVTSADPFIQSRYAGFLSVSTAAVMELALKEIITSFASSKHPLFGDYVGSRYEMINGRIKITHIYSDHLSPFGEKYKKRFDKLLNRVERIELRKNKYSIRSSYANLLNCRHQFAHEGSVPTNSTYQEIKKGFEAGKVVMKCLAKTLAAQ